SDTSAQWGSRPPVSPGWPGLCEPALPRPAAFRPPATDSPGCCGCWPAQSDTSAQWGSRPPVSPGGPGLCDAAPPPPALSPNPPPELPGCCGGWPVAGGTVALRDPRRPASRPCRRPGESLPPLLSFDQDGTRSCRPDTPPPRCEPATVRHPPSPRRIPDS